MTGRYDTAGNPEDEYYPGTSVLINLEGIRDPEELLERETELHLAAYEEMFGSFDERLTPDLPFFYYLHHMIFSRLYVWAGLSRMRESTCAPVSPDSVRTTAQCLPCLSGAPTEMSPGYTHVHPWMFF